MRSLLKISLLGFCLLSVTASADVFRSVKMIIMDNTGIGITVMGYEDSSGHWGFGGVPEAGEIIGSEQTGAFSSVSTMFDVGVSGVLWLNVGTVAWRLPWFGDFYFEPKLSDPSIKMGYRCEGVPTQRVCFLTFNK